MTTKKNYSKHLFSKKCGIFLVNSKSFCKFAVGKYNRMNKRVLNSIRELLAQTLPPYATARLYGSQARGDAHRGSDWDILIIMDKDQLLPDDYDTVTYPLTKLGWELGAEINPIMYTKKEWEQSRITPFYHNVEQDAIAL